MKLTLLLIIVAFLGAVASESYAQSARLTIKMENRTIEEVLNEIENRSSFRFFYNGTIDVDQEVTVNFENENISVILDQIFKGTEIQYKLMGRQITLASDADETSIFNQGPKKITGKVTEPSGLPLPGVSVIIKGSSSGTVTNFDGEYSLSNVPGNATLVFSFVGMKTQEIPVAGKSDIIVVLEEETIGLEEVVAVGYGTMKKSDLTGSVTSVRVNEIQSSSALSVDDALQGQAAGVLVSSASGSPGGGLNITIRGGNSINAGNQPLYVIDGFPVYNESSDYNPDGGNAVGGLAGLDPNDIESLEILKDASATSIYGSRGANGVILITTKRGQKGQTNIDFDMSYGTDIVSNIMPMLNLRETVEMQNEANLNSNAIPTWFKSDIDSMINVMGEAGTNWQDYVMQNALRSNYSLRISGGTDKIRYSVSSGYSTQEGIIINSGFDRYNFRTNLDANLSKKLTVGTSFSASLTDVDIKDPNRIIFYATRKQPYSPVYVTEDNIDLWTGSVGVAVGNFAPKHPQGEGGSQSNPLAEVYENTNKNRSVDLTGNVFVDYELMKGLKLRVSGGAKIISTQNNRYQSSLTEQADQDNGIARRAVINSLDFLNENTLTYDNTFGDHHVNILGGFTIQKKTMDQLSVETRNFVSDILKYYDMDAGLDYRTPSSFYRESTMASWISRFNYNYKGKYYFTFTGRADGSSRFGSNTKWGFFPSGSLAWRISDEEFVRSLNIFDELKLRTSFGYVGNQEIGLYNSLTRYSSTVYTPDGTNLATGVYMSTLGNNELGWEKTGQFNIGLDVGFFNSKLYITAEYYKKKTTDLLLSVDLPGDAGISKVLSNVGAVSNEGFELSLTSQNIAKGKFRWSTTFNFSSNKNRVEELYKADYYTYSRNLSNVSVTSLIKVGQPLGTFYGPIFDGIYQSQTEIDNDPVYFAQSKVGGQRYKDLNGDGKFDSNDYGIIGHGTPDFIAGMTNKFSYRNFDFRIFLNGVFGRDILNINRTVMEDMYPDHGAYKTVMNRWSLSSPSEVMPAAGRNYSRNYATSQHLENGSYVRIQTMQLGYKLPARRFKWMRRGRIFVSVDDFWTFTKYSGYDPEVNSTGFGALKSVDKDSYPTPRTYRFGLSLGL